MLNDMTLQKKPRTVEDVAISKIKEGPTAHCRLAVLERQHVAKAIKRAFLLAAQDMVSTYNAHYCYTIVKNTG